MKLPESGPEEPGLASGTQVTTLSKRDQSLSRLAAALRPASADDEGLGIGGVSGEVAGLRSTALPAVVASDVVALSLALFLATLVDGWVKGRPSPVTALTAILYVPVFLPFFSGYGLYRRARRRLVASMFPDIGHLAHAVLLTCLVLLASTKHLQATLGLPAESLAGTASIGVLAMLAVPACRMLARVLRRPADGNTRVVIVGSGHVAAVVLQRLKAVPGTEVVGYVDDGASPGVALTDVPKLGGLDDLTTAVRSQRIGHIVVAFSPASGAKLAELLRSLADEVRISVVPRLFDLLTVRSHVDDLHGLPVVDVAPAALGPADRFAKRALDILLSLATLVLSLPVVAGIAVVVRLTSPGPILFRQERTGRDNRPFFIYKFRTMYHDADLQKKELSASNEVDGPIFKLHLDPRVTPVGAFLRRTSLDELPQLFNVLRGNMSLVGPRPFVESEASAIDGWAARRFAVRPGITGLWQISGRSDLPFEELRRLDYSYVASWSLVWDLRILWHTPAAVLKRRGAY